MNLPEPETLVLNLRDFPDWHIHNGIAPSSPRRNNRDDGLTSIPIPAGHSQIHIVYTTLPDQLAGAILTLLCHLDSSHQQSYRT